MSAHPGDSTESMSSVTIAATTFPISADSQTVVGRRCALSYMMYEALRARRWFEIWTLLPESAGDDDANVNSMDTVGDVVEIAPMMR